MPEKNIQSRIQHKHDIEANWLKATNFIPKAGELIIYDVDSNNAAPRFKIGDGTTVVSSLPFSNDVIQADIDNKVEELQQLITDSKADWNQIDETAIDYIKNKPDEMTSDDVVDMLMDLELMTPMVNENGAILTDNNGAILTL